MPRLLIPDDLSGEEVERHMLCLNESLKVLHGSAREAMLKRQVRNLREYNTRKAVHTHGHEETFFPGDMVWVKDMNPCRNKLQQQYAGPYYIRRMVGENERAAQLSLDGQHFIIRSVEHLCHYHKNFRGKVSAVETGGEFSGSMMDEPKEGVETPFTWSCAVAPEARSQLEKLAVKNWNAETL